MSKSTAIKSFCRECSGGNFKDVALCTDIKCHLWPHRLSVHPTSAGYRRIMDKVKKRFPADVADLPSYGLGWPDFAGGPTVNKAVCDTETAISEAPLSPYVDEDEGIVFSQEMPILDKEGEI